MRTVYFALNHPSIEGWFVRRFKDEFRVVGSGASVAQVLADLQREQPDLLVAAPEFEGVGVPDLEQILSAVKYWLPHTRVALLAWAPDAPAARVAAQLGIGEIVAPPPGSQLRPEEVEEAVRRLFPPEPLGGPANDPWAAWGDGAAGPQAPVPVPPEPPASPEPPAPPAPPTATAQSKIANPWDAVPAAPPQPPPAPAPFPAAEQPAHQPSAVAPDPRPPLPPPPPPPATPEFPADPAPEERFAAPPSGVPAPLPSWGAWPDGSSSQPGAPPSPPPFPTEAPGIPWDAPPAAPGGEERGRGGLFGGRRRRPQFAPAPAIPEPGSVVPSRLVCVVGDKGGTAKTVVTAGLAALAARRRISAVAVDFDSENADLAFEFGLVDAKVGLSGLARECMSGADPDIRLVHPPGPELVRRHIQSTKAGVSVLPGLDAARIGTPSGRAWLALAEHVVRELGAMYQLVAVDCGSLLDAPLPWGALHQANVVVITTGNEAKDIRDMERVLAVLEHGGVPRERCLLAVTRYRPGGGLYSPEDIARHVRVPLSAVFHDDRAAYMAATAQGRPLSLSERSGPWHKLLSDVYAAALPPDRSRPEPQLPAVAPPRRSALARMFGSR